MTDNPNKIQRARAALKAYRDAVKDEASSEALVLSTANEMSHALAAILPPTEYAVWQGGRNFSTPTLVVTGLRSHELQKWLAENDPDGVRDLEVRELP